MSGVSVKPVHVRVALCIYSRPYLVQRAAENLARLFVPARMLRFVILPDSVDVARLLDDHVSH